MLEGLDDVAWETLHHAYGPATDVPPLLRTIASDDAAARTGAWDNLNGNLWHQGTVYEATAHAVPFLIELSQAPQVAERHLVLVYLGSLASGNSYWDVHQHMSLFAEERTKPDFKEQLDRELAWVRAAREAVRAGTDHYAVLLADLEPIVRTGAAYLIGHFHEDAERNIGLIRGHLDAEKHDMVRHRSCRSAFWPLRIKTLPSGWSRCLRPTAQMPCALPLLWGWPGRGATPLPPPRERCLHKPLLLRARPRRRSRSFHGTLPTFKPTVAKRLRSLPSTRHSRCQR